MKIYTKISINTDSPSALHRADMVASFARYCADHASATEDLETKVFNRVPVSCGTNIFQLLSMSAWFRSTVDENVIVYYDQFGSCNFVNDPNIPKDSILVKCWVPDREQILEFEY